MIERLTTDPDDFGPDDIEALGDAGVSDAGIRDVIYVCVLFNTMNRLSDALGFEIPSDEAHRKLASSLLQRGYRVPPPMAWLGRP